MKSKKRMYIILAYGCGVLAGVFGICTAHFAYKASIEPTKQEIEIQKKKDKLKIPFKSKPNHLNVLVIPFEPYGNDGGLNVAKGIYDRMVEFKEQKNLENLSLRYYDILQPTEINRETAEKIGEKLNADLIIMGKYQLKDMDESIAQISQLNLKSNVERFDRAQTIKFNNIIEAFEEHLFTKTIEENIEFKLLTVLNDFWYLDSQEFSKLEWFLFKKFLQNKGTSHSDLEDNLMMEVNSIWKAKYHADIVESENYGLSIKTPLYGGYHEAIYKTYLELLTYEGKPIKIGRQENIEEDFKRHITGSEEVITHINSYQILNEDGEEIDVIYVFEKSYKEHLKPPKGFSFPYEINERNTLANNE